NFLYEFYNRKDLVENMISIAKRNYENRGMASQANHTMVLIPGGAGIGKSRAGWESQYLLSHAEKFEINTGSLSNGLLSALESPLYLYIDFSSGHQYNQQLDRFPSSESAEYTRSASIRIGLRVALAAGLVRRLDDETLNNLAIDDFSIGNVLKRILELRSQSNGHELEAIIIHMDEYQQYIDSLQGYMKLTWDDARKEFKQMLKEIGNVMRNSQDDGYQFFILQYVLGRQLRTYTFYLLNIGSE
ncbi:hypothetical protein BGX21_006161, partial [Mortierella sp. AD011]